LAIDTAWDLKKEFFILVPVLGSALAIIFDVGYFTAIGLNWFSVFSTTEHITFSLQVLPFAWAFAAGSASGMFLGFRQGIAAETYGTKQLLWPTQIVTVALAVLGVLSAWLLQSATLSVMAGGYIFALFLVWYFYRDERRYMILFGYGTFFLCAFAFALGYDVAKNYQNQADYPYTVTTAEGDQSAKVVRSGDKGLLFYQGGTAQLVLLPWSELKKVQYKKMIPRKTTVQ
jgi:hypothetical protein